MSTVDRKRRSIQKAFVITALLVSLVVVGYLVVRSGHAAPDGVKPASAGPVSASEAPRPLVATSAPTTVASRAVVATRTSGAAPPWQASLQPAVVAATRVDSLVAYQVQMEHWACEGDQCVGNFRIPPTVAASRNMSSASQIFDSLKQQMAKEDVDVTLNSIQPGPQGLAVSFQFMPTAAIPARVYTDREISAIRAESFEQGHAATEQERNVHGRDPAR